MDYAENPKSEPFTNMARNRLNESLEQLEKMVAELHERLRDVVRETEPSTDEAMVRPDWPGTAELTRYLNERADRLADLFNRLRNITDRLEI